MYCTPSRVLHLLFLLPFWSPLEKLSIAKSYKYLEKFTAALDSLYDSGVGEEYLASLVKSSNESATRARHLKESPVTDLRDMLLHLAESQKIENERLANTLSATYRESGSQFADQSAVRLKTA